MNYVQYSNRTHVRKKCGFVVFSKKPNEENLNQDLLRQFLHYDPQTGVFTWITYRNARIEYGTTAGCVGKTGYRRIRILGKPYRASRLAFLYMIGEWPTQEVDHINRNRDDNRWDNLRDVSRSENQKNKSRIPRPTATGSLHTMRRSGGMGVSWHSKSRKWRASINIDSKKKWIGEFNEQIDAIKARLNKEIELNYYGDKKFESPAYKAFFNYLVAKY